MNTDSDDDSMGPVKVVSVQEAQKTAVKPKDVKPRNTWTAIHKYEYVEGERRTTYPFLDSSNLKDTMLIRHLIVGKPFKADFGKVLNAWQDVADVVNKEIDDNGQVLFYPPLTGKGVRERYEKLVSVAKEMRNAVPFRSGCDDEEPPNEIQQGIEELLAMMESLRATKGTSKQENLASKKADKDAAEIIRRASLGQKPSKEDFATIPTKMLSRKKQRLRKNSESGTDSGSEKTNTGMNPGGFTKSADSLFHGHTEMVLLKEENKKRALDIQSEKIEIKKQKIETIKAERKQKMELEIAERKQKMEIAAAESQAAIKEKEAMTQILMVMLNKFSGN